MHLKLAEYCFNLENNNYDNAIKVLEDNKLDIVNNLNAKHKNINIEQYKIIIDLLKYNAMILRDRLTDNKLNSYVNINNIDLLIYNSDTYLKDLLGISLSLYSYDQDKDYDYSTIKTPIIRHINYLKLVIDRYVTILRVNKYINEWVDKFENQTGIVYDNLYKNAPELISRYLIRSQYTQY